MKLKMTTTSTAKPFNRLSISQKHEIFKELSVLGVSLAIIVLLWRSNLLLFAILLSIYSIRSCFWHKVGNHQIFLVGGLLVSAVEVLLVAAGVYQFAYPSLLNIPLWIPLAWGMGSVAVYRSLQQLITTK